jgi:transcription-repair coupling factor (superfamily II helicase)
VHTASPLHPVLPGRKHPVINWGRLYGNSPGLLLASCTQEFDGFLLVVTRDMQQANLLEHELKFFLSGQPDISILSFPDWETLPYDLFSPHEDIISKRLQTLSHLPKFERGILIVPVATLMQRLAPLEYVQASTLVMETGDTLPTDKIRKQLDSAGYHHVSQVMEHGEYTVRGSILDLFPMGCELPFRIDLFDEEIESIRSFDPETQRTISKINEIRLLPAHEFPMHEEAISLFRQNYRKRFEGDPQKSPVYREVSNGNVTGGLEYYLPLFFAQTRSLTDYLPDNTVIISLDGADTATQQFWEQINQRYESLSHDTERPILKPEEIYISPTSIIDALSRLPRANLQWFEYTDTVKQDHPVINYQTSAPPPLFIQNNALEPHTALLNFLNGFKGRVLLAAETTGRRELILEILRKLSLFPVVLDHWQDFYLSDVALAITVAPLEEGLMLQDPALAIIAESQLFGSRAVQKRRRKKSRTDAENIIRNLTDLHQGDPVVHEEHGIGRYLGLQKLNVGNIETEFLTLEYADEAKLYVPVASLHLISRYSGASPENAPLHKLGSDHWQKAKRRAAERARDVAAELLDVYARRAARKGHSYSLDHLEYTRFAAAFPFEETPDQLAAIESVIADMKAEQPMDRVVCGDVGFGKTEVAMRATFTAAQATRQVAVLVPTTLLAQQHYQNFLDRFADWPFKIEVLSRFRTGKDSEDVIKQIENGKIDIIIGTHKLLQKDIKFKDLGLLIIDEEHRFGVRQKERLKSLRTEIDILTLTATPIPRTLNMSLSGLRDLSIIATAPTERVAIKTFVSEWIDNLLLEAFLREIKRGGQIYFLHNEVSTIDRIAGQIQELVPQAKVAIAHGQMRERDLEQVMLDFYHQKYNILVCTTIIESGIDIPSANTIIINRADKLGLAQLHQLRGRVGRSHHRAYAYLLIPGRKSITADALKRLEAIESLENLGAGFMLATHDLEIRGAGELLGEGQSGQIHEVGFTLYTELLERAVDALKSGQEPDLDKPLDHGPEIDLQIPALIPEDYLPDIHSRLVLYKRIASAANDEQLKDIQVEMIDRFGLLPAPVKNLISITELKIHAAVMGINKIDVGDKGGRLLFTDNPDINPINIIKLIQEKPDIYKLDGKNKLRFYMSLEDNDKRFRAVVELLELLQAA